MTATVDPEEAELANLLFAEETERLNDIAEALEKNDVDRVKILVSQLLDLATMLSRRERFLAERPFPGLH